MYAAALSLAALLVGCYSSSDGRDTFDGGRTDGAIVVTDSAGSRDAETSIPSDAPDAQRPSGGPTEHLLALRVDDMGGLSLHEMDMTFRAMGDPIEVPAPHGHQLHVGSDRRIHVLGSDTADSGERVHVAQILDLGTRTWESRALPIELGDTVIPYGDGWIFLVPADEGPHRLVRWNNEELVSVDVDVGGASYADLHMGRNGIVYVVTYVSEWIGFDATSLAEVDRFRPPAASATRARVDYDGSVVIVNGSAERWYRTGELVRGPRAVHGFSRFHDLSERGFMVGEDLYANASVFSSELVEVSHGEWVGLDKPIGWAWVSAETALDER